MKPVKPSKLRLQLQKLKSKAATGAMPPPKIVADKRRKKPKYPETE